MTFHEKLRIMRKQLNLTQQQIANTLGIDRSAYSYYETGKSCPPMDKLAILTKMFNITSDELMCLPPPKGKPDDESSSYENYNPVNPIAPLPKDEQELLLLYRSMPNSMCDDVLKYMRNQLKLADE